MIEWPKKPTTWTEGRTLFISVPFTWNLPSVKNILMHRDFFWDKAVVGGPAVELMPEYLPKLDHVTIGHHMPGVLQRVNPLATRTTEGCTRTCGFCGVGTGKIEGGLTSPYRLALPPDSLRQQHSGCFGCSF